MLCYRCGSHVQDGAQKCWNCSTQLAGNKRRSATSVEVRARQGTSARILGVVFKVGDLIGNRYRVMDILGSGGVGVVYRAHDQEIDVDVAIKVVNAKLVQTPDEQRVFSRQAKLARKLTHQNVVRVYDDGRDEQRPFFTMQYLEGLSLRRIIDLRREKRQVFQAAEVEPIFNQLCQALEHAHRTTFHGNLKPDNVIVLPDLLKVTDFGLLRGLPRKPFLAIQKSRGSNFRYLAPEVRLEVAELDRHVDVFSLGVILLEMVSGLVYDDAHPEALAEGAAQVEPRLLAVIRRALGRAPNERQSSVGEFFEEVRAAFSSVSVFGLSTREAMLAGRNPVAVSELSPEDALSGEATEHAPLHENGRDALSSRKSDVGAEAASEAEANVPAEAQAQPKTQPPGDEEHAPNPGPHDRVTVLGSSLAARDPSGSFALIDDDMIEGSAPLARASMHADGDEPNASHAALEGSIDRLVDPGRDEVSELSSDAIESPASFHPAFNMGESSPPELGAVEVDADEALEVPVLLDDDEEDTGEQPEPAPSVVPFSLAQPVMYQQAYDAGLVVVSPSRSLAARAPEGFRARDLHPVDDDEDETIAIIDDEIPPEARADARRNGNGRDIKAGEPLVEISNSSIQLIDDPLMTSRINRKDPPPSSRPTERPRAFDSVSVHPVVGTPSAFARDVETADAEEDGDPAGYRIEPAGPRAIYEKGPRDVEAREKELEAQLATLGCEQKVDEEHLAQGPGLAKAPKERPATRPRIAIAPIPSALPVVTTPPGEPSRAVRPVTMPVLPTILSAGKTLPRPLVINKALFITIALSALALVLSVIVVLKVTTDARTEYIAELDRRLALLQKKEQQALEDARIRAESAEMARRAEEEARIAAEEERARKKSAEAAAEEREAAARKLDIEAQKATDKKKKAEATKAAQAAKLEAEEKRKAAAQAAAREREAELAAKRERQRREEEERAKAKAEQRQQREAEARKKAEAEAERLKAEAAGQRKPPKEDSEKPNQLAKAPESGAKATTVAAIVDTAKDNAPAPSADPKCPKGMAAVRLGSFTMGSQASDPERGFEDLAPKTAEVKSFCIDYYEYPNGRGRQPTVGVSWKTADARCKQRGKRLCTEPEWERACKGQSGTRYPYGNQWSGEACATEDDEGNDRSVSQSGAFKSCRSGYNVFDLSGNAAEWTATQDGSFYIVKGGSADRPGYDGRCAARKKKKPGDTTDVLGFRCCADPE